MQDQVRVFSLEPLPQAPLAELSPGMSKYVGDLSNYLRRLTQKVEQGVKRADFTSKQYVDDNDDLVENGVVNLILEGPVAELSEWIVSVEDRVTVAEEEIATGVTDRLVYEEMVHITGNGSYVASTGNWSGRHLYFEIWTSSNSGYASHIYADPTAGSDTTWTTNLVVATIGVVVKQTTGQLEITVTGYTGPAFDMHILVVGSRRETSASPDRTI